MLSWENLETILFNKIGFPYKGCDVALTEMPRGIYMYSGAQ